MEEVQYWRGFIKSSHIKQKGNQKPNQSWQAKLQGDAGNRNRVMHNSGIITPIKYEWIQTQRQRVASLACTQIKTSWSIRHARAQFFSLFSATAANKWKWATHCAESWFVMIRRPTVRSIWETKYVAFVSMVTAGFVATQHAKHFSIFHWCLIWFSLDLHINLLPRTCNNQNVTFLPNKKSKMNFKKICKIPHT